MTSRKEKHYRAGFKELFNVYWNNPNIPKWLIPWDLFLLTVDACMQAAVPALLGYVIAQLEKDPAHFVKHQLLWMSITAACAVVLFYFVAMTQHYLNHKIGTLALVAVQARLYSHLQNLDADFHQRVHVGEITSRLTNDTVKGVQELYPQIAYVYWMVCLIVISLIMMSQINLKMFFVFLSVIGLFAILSAFMLPFLRRLYREAQDELGRVNARMTEDMTAISLIQAYARETMLYQEIKHLCDKYLEKALRSRRIGVYFGDITNTFINFIGPLSLLFVGSLLIGDDFGIPELVAFFAYWRVSAAQVMHLMQQMTLIFGSLASFDRVFEFFKVHPSITDKPHAKEIHFNGVVEFKNVTFRYPVDSGEDVLKEASFTAEKQKSLAIVGESGAGKSTIISLLLRFYAPSTGAIHIDGSDILDLKQSNLREQIGLVMQDTIILSSSVRQNMLLARPDATDTQILDALEHAEARTFVTELPDGLDTNLGERGVRLSGGQRQRLAIARVFLKNPPIVVLDEATSALDTITEKKIQETMKRLFEGRTSIIIAHRLSTIVESDKILMLEKGKVIASGDHAELLQSCQLYKELCEKQALAS